MTEDDDNLVSKLRGSIGLVPNAGWLASCRTFLLGTRGGSGNNRGGILEANNDGSQEGFEDAILNQILHSDLRDVVRPESAVANGVAATCTTNAPAQQLRDAIRASQPQQATLKNNPKTSVKLGKTFRLFCQIEEVMDVSLNAEARVGNGNSNGNGNGNTSGRNPGSNNNSNNCSGPKPPSLKLCLTDGYMAEPITAMAVERIPGLDAKTLAGAKLVLTGPLEMIWGTLLLHPGNTMVAGGYVDDLVQFQKLELEKAKQAAGVGVDMTVRALIGTSPDSLEEQDEEGEGESRDVDARVLQHQHAQAQPQRLQLPPGQQEDAPHPLGGITGQTHLRQVSTSPVSSPIPFSSPPLRRLTHETSRDSGVENSFGQSQRDPTPPTQPLNPYGRSNSTRAPSEVPKSSAGAVNQPVSNPYASRASQSQHSSTSTTNSRSNSTRNPYTTPQSQPQPLYKSATGSLAPPVEYHGPSGTAKSDHPNGGSASDPRQYEDRTRSTAATVSSSSSSTVPHSSSAIVVSFESFVRLLKTAVSDPNSYKVQYGKVFAVPLKQQGRPINFDIKKRKERAKVAGKGDKEARKKKYEFFMTAPFTGPFGGESITCKISSSCIEPYFDQSPADIRSISRTDRDKSNQMVKEGGNRTKNALFGLSTWQLRLGPTIEEFTELVGRPEFSISGETPILHLLGRHVASTDDSRKA